MSLCSAVFFLVLPWYGIPIQAKKTLWSSTMSSDLLSHWNCQILSQEVVVGDLLSALERIFCAEGQLKLLGDLGTRCCTFLGSGTTTPEARSLVGGNMSGFPQFLGNSEFFSIQNWWFWGWCFWNPLSFQVFLTWQLASPSIPSNSETQVQMNGP